VECVEINAWQFKYVIQVDVRWNVLLAKLPAMVVVQIPHPTLIIAVIVEMFAVLAQMLILYV